MASFYRERHPDGPFATLIAVVTTYLSPEGYDLESLQRLAKRQDDKEMRVFKAELRAAIRDGELSESVEYDDGSDEAFLRRLWHDLYGDEPLNAPRALFDPDPEFAALSTADLLAIVPRPGASFSAPGGR